MRSMGAVGLSGIVLTYNEEAHLADCLASLTWVDDLLVVDSFSTDRTLVIARRFTDRVVQRPFGDYASQRQAALALARGEWVLFVDADERVPPALAAEIRTVLSAPGPFVGFWIPRRNIIWGRWIRHGGWFPDYQLRLFRRDRGRYDPTRPVHEVVLLDGPAGHLQTPLLHYNYATVGEFLAKQRRYTALEVERLRRAGVRPRARSLVGQPLREFWRRYVRLGGWRDGLHGLLLALFLAYYTHCAYRQRWREGRAG